MEEDDDDLNIVVEESDNKDDDFVEKDAKSMEKQENATEQNENTVDFMGGMIPGLSGKLENQGGPNPEDDWESDESEDDLQSPCLSRFDCLYMQIVQKIAEIDSGIF